ncbi:Hypothetical protein CINCED_3A013355 [Cinara cedri]|uniref:Uncharacterized protein n=1 Tax=Cinara cedri TaxID=506608 RepID=A0A5E4NS02_9HEMI|nr:Hypothetical protein CINCED_3A013355 [Cinara cedri]
MWWPRPRWKINDILSVYFALLFIVVTNASVAMADDGGQRCDESNTSAVIWTTALCTTLLILVIIAVYFAYCKRKEHDWSSLWWKNNPDKNIVLQTSPPTKVRRQKIDGADNPSFSADSNLDDCGVVEAGTAITRESTHTVQVPSSATVAVNELMEIDLSINEESGRQIYMCKHNNGSKDRVVALRLVFDNKGTAQPNFGRASDLSRSLTELVREYGLHVELETEAAAAYTPPCATAAVEYNGGNDTEKPSVKSNILSAVRGTAQRLWNQKELVFKSSGGDCNDRARREDANKMQNCSGAADVENGHASSSAIADVDATAVSPTREKSPCSAVTVVNETVQKSSANRLQYRTLEYGASPADMDAQSSPECSIQCGTVIDSLEPGRTVTSLTSAAPAAVATENDAVATSDCYVTAQVPVVDCSEGTVVVTVDDDDAKSHVEPNVNNVNESSNKHAAANPPPPPPRKYYVSTVPPVVPSAVTTSHDVPTVTETTNTLQHIAPNRSTVTPEKASPSSSPSDNSEIPVVVPDDYYWCTTTVMAPPVLSTFGKRLSAAETVGDEKEVEEEERGNIIRRVDNNGEVEDTGMCNGGEVVAAVEQLHVHGGSVAVTGGVTTTTSIEDASLPSFSSDEDDEDNGVFVEKTKSQCSAVADNALDECNSTVNGVTGKRNNGDGKETVVKVTSGQPGRYNNTAEDCVMSPPVGAAGREPKSPITKLPTLRQQSSPPTTTANNTSTYFGSSSASTSSSSSSSSSPSSPTNHSGNNNNNSPIVSKIPVRRQSAGSGGGGGTTVVSSPLTNGTGKKSIPLPLSRSGSRLAMWSSVN